MNVDAFILARLGSSRLPQKHLLEIQDKPIIQHLFERISKCKTIRKIVVCTTDNISDDPLINFLEKEKITWFRGSEHDIVKRLLDAAKNYDTDLIVDIEGDKIYTEPEFVDRSVHMMLNSDYDFLMGSSFPTSVDHSDHSVAAVFPAIIKKSALEKVNSTKNHNNTETGYREYFTSNPIFNCKYVSLPNLEIPKNLRLTIDYEQDIKLAKIIFKNFGNSFSFVDIIELFNKNPDLLGITNEVLEKWKENYNQKSLK